MGQKISTKSAMQCAIDDMKSTLSNGENKCLSLLKIASKSLPFASMKEELLTLSISNKILNY